MKPIFCIDVTLDKNNQEINGTQFITRTASEEATTALEQKQASLNNTVQSSQFPLWLTILKYILGAYALMVLCSSIPVGFKKAFNNAPVLIITAFVCGIAWAIIQFCGIKKQKRTLSEQNAEAQVDDIQKDIQNIYDELGVPRTAYSVDVLLCIYKTIDGKIRPKAARLQTTPYYNAELKMYVSDNCLCFSDVYNVYSFNLCWLKAIKTIKKRIILPLWNKEEPPTKGEFKRYKMSQTNTGEVSIKPYYVLEIEHDGDLYGIYFPCYELATFERLTGLNAQE